MNLVLDNFILKYKDIKHSKTNLYDHLKHSYTLLRNLNPSIPEYVCLAAGLHSVYGTNIFKGLGVDICNRQKIIEIFGLACEELVHLFSILNRPSELNINKNIFINRITHQEVFISDLNLEYLRLIEAVNLIDQNYPLTTFNNIYNTYMCYKQES